MEFPMMTVSSNTLLAMTRMQPYEELKLKDSLVKFEECLGKAMFVSHQWVTPDNPDPELKQLGVLQQALGNLISGRSQVSLSVEIESMFGRVKCPKAADFISLYLWYDYFSCPQGHTPEAVAERELAISCIPAYVASSVFFVILCPSLTSRSYSLNHSTLAARGWCRLEHLARELSRDDGFSIIIKKSSHPTLVYKTNGLCRPPGTGNFSFDVDRQRVGQLVLQMLWKKLHQLLHKGEMHKYRFLLNVHHFYLQGFECRPIESLVPAFHTDIDISTHVDAFLVARFLHDNRFKTISDRDPKGWSPACYAVLTGKGSLVKAFLNSRANVNDVTTRSTSSLGLPKKMPLLSLATTYHSNEVMHVLLSARANVNARCGHRVTALSWAAVSDNAAAVQPLLQARVDPAIKSFVEVSPFRTACVCGSVGVMKEMLSTIRSQISLRFALHCAVAFSGEAKTVSCLIEASADVNERMHIPRSRPAIWSFMRMLHLIHYLSPSALTYLAYHHYGATPLTFCVLTGKFELIPLLLAAGARWDIPNDRGKTADMFLKEMSETFHQDMWVASDEEGLGDVSEVSDETVAVAL